MFTMYKPTFEMSQYPQYRILTRLSQVLSGHIEDVHVVLSAEKVYLWMLL
mgnify:CR=1 FL=1